MHSSLPKPEKDARRKEGRKEGEKLLNFGRVYLTEEFRKRGRSNCDRLASTALEEEKRWHKASRDICRIKEESPLEENEIGNRGKLLANDNHSWETNERRNSLPNRSTTKSVELGRRQPATGFLYSQCIALCRESSSVRPLVRNAVIRKIIILLRHHNLKVLNLSLNSIHLERPHLSPQTFV